MWAILASPNHIFYPGTYFYLEHISDRVTPKENGPSYSSEQDVTMADVGVSPTKPSSSPTGPSLIEGISKSSYVNQASDPKVTSAKVAPYNTFYSQLEEHMNEVGIDPSINKWDEPVALGLVDPHDSLSYPAGVSHVQAESVTRLEPDQYINFVIPNWMGSELAGSTKDNPFVLPDPCFTTENHKSLAEVKHLLRETQLEEAKKRELSSALHSCFKDWLYASGNIRQLHSVQGE